MTTDLKLELPNFEGPLDLLLHLIRIQKIDIYDIPIARITHQYLMYLQAMKKMNLQIAGDYFVMASTLIRIKSQDLLPQNDFVDDTAENDDDPRAPLVEQLVEYAVFKRISTYFHQRAQQQPLVVAKEPTPSPDHQVKPLPFGQFTPEQLSHRFASILFRYRLRQPQRTQVSVAPASVNTMMTYLKNVFSEHPIIYFTDCLATLHDLDHAVALFLASLEMSRQHRIKITQKEAFSDLILERITLDGH